MKRLCWDLYLDRKSLKRITLYDTNTVMHSDNFIYNGKSNSKSVIR